MKRGIIRVKQLPNRHGMLTRQRYIAINARGKIFGIGPEGEERNCMLVLLGQLEISKIVAIWRGAVSSVASSFRDEQKLSRDGRHIIRLPNDAAAIANLFCCAEQEGVSVELKIAVAHGEIVTCVANDNDEHWFLLGSEKVLTDTWVAKCEHALPQWKFIIKTG